MSFFFEDFHRVTFILVLRFVNLLSVRYHFHSRAYLPHVLSTVQRPPLEISKISCIFRSNINVFNPSPPPFLFPFPSSASALPLPSHPSVQPPTLSQTGTPPPNPQPSPLGRTLPYDA